ncbi:hypothetical protein [Sporolactobacillus laevolacticus]|uniref:hypothetical protein n=1 Tax=Sporolactobacillus laevolacticus TaxID=33018 RepID=UPI00144314A3|nr:hypothetical protein [Sporolactobacillus laevolacticus]
MNQAHYLMPGVIQVTGGDGHIETKEEFDQWYRSFMREIGVSIDGHGRTIQQCN